MNIKLIKEYLEEKKQPKFRLTQIIKAVYQDGVLSFSEISTIPKELRQELDDNFSIFSFAVKKLQIAPNKSVTKALLELGDGSLIETVLISNRDKQWSVCISSQVGCPLRCTFCATGQSGFKRNLTGAEISDQVLYWSNYLKSKKLGTLTNVIYMGMGEPFLNWDNVKRSIEILTDDNLLNLGMRSLSVSTVGIPDGIKQLARDFPQVNLAISLHSANDKKRDEITPINKKYNIKQLKKAIEVYLENTNRKVMIEYLMIDQFNDTPDDVEDLVKFIESFSKNQLFHVNLIPYNQTSAEFQPSQKDRIEKFKKDLLKNKISTTIRRSLGTEIDGACGQLLVRTE